LPSVAAPVERPLVAAGWADSVSTTGEVLYIEDNPVNTMIVGELVRRREGLTMLSADTGNAGVVLALAQLPALILLDMQLPDIDGMEVFRRLRADVRTAGIPCIALSAEAHESDIRRALDAGFTGYLTKPVDFEAFDRALDAIFQGASFQHIDLPAGEGH
jgi:CheY-like chemotaxis protein